MVRREALLGCTEARLEGTSAATMKSEHGEGARRSLSFGVRGGRGCDGWGGREGDDLGTGRMEQAGGLSLDIFADSGGLDRRLGSDGSAKGGRRACQGVETGRGILGFCRKNSLSRSRGRNGGGLTVVNGAGDSNSNGGGPRSCGCSRRGGGLTAVWR
jgi:hypothetical protein